MDVKIYIREIGTDKLAATVPVHNASERRLERVENGLLRNMDLDKFYIDTDEADATLAAKAGE